MSGNLEIPQRFEDFKDLEDFFGKYRQDELGRRALIKVPEFSVVETNGDMIIVYNQFFKLIGQIYKAILTDKKSMISYYMQFSPKDKKHNNSNFVQLYVANYIDTRSNGQRYFLLNSGENKIPLFNLLQITPIWYNGIKACCKELKVIYADNKQDAYQLASKGYLQKTK